MMISRKNSDVTAVSTRHPTPAFVLLLDKKWSRDKNFVVSSLRFISNFCGHGVFNFFKSQKFTILS